MSEGPRVWLARSTLGGILELEAPMSYQFPPDVDRLVKSQMASGDYASEDEVLRAALRALTHSGSPTAAPQVGQISSLAELREEVRRGLEQIDRGESHDAGVVFEDLLRDLPEAPSG